MRYSYGFRGWILSVDREQIISIKFLHTTQMQAFIILNHDTVGLLAEYKNLFRSGEAELRVKLRQFRQARELDGLNLR